MTYRTGILQPDILFREAFGRLVHSWINEDAKKKSSLSSGAAFAEDTIIRMRALLVLPALALVTGQNLPPFNSVVYVFPAFESHQVQTSLRHCFFNASFDPIDATDLDFQFVLVQALNGLPAPAVSFQSTNFPTKYLSYTANGTPIGSRVGIVEASDNATASWEIAPATGGGVTIKTLSTLPFLSGKLLTISTNATGPCLASKSTDAVLGQPGSEPLPSQAFIVSITPPKPYPTPSPAPPPPMVPATLVIDASHVDHVISPALRGCHMDPGFGNDVLAWTSNMVYGQAFAPGTPKVYAWSDASSAGE